MKIKMPNTYSLLLIVLTLGTIANLLTIAKIAPRFVITAAWLPVMGMVLYLGNMHNNKTLPKPKKMTGVLSIIMGLVWFASYLLAIFL